MGIPPEDGKTEVVALHSLSVARLLFQLLRGRFTGTLEMSQPPPNEGERTVWFQGGMPVFTDWFDERDMLGQVAVDQGAITEDDLQKALAQKTAGQMLGDALEQMGVIDADKLREALREQCKRKLVHLFGLKSGRMTVCTTDHQVGKGDGLGQINVLELILAGVTRHYDEVRVTLEIGKEAQGHVTATGSLGRYAGHFRFEGRAKPILEALARGSSLDDLEELSGVGRQRAAQVMFTLWCCEMLETGTAPASDAGISGVMDAFTEARQRREELVGRTPEPESDGDDWIEAKAKAEAALKAQRYASAHQAYLSAAKANPDDGEVAAGLIWCRYQLSAQAENDGEEAARDLAGVVGQHPRLARAQYYRGVISQELGRDQDALAAYKAAAGLDPHLKDAIRRARAMAKGRRRPKAKAKSKGSNPLLEGRMPLFLIAGGALIVAMLVANILVGLDW
jgi:tetratricopeptide (TPR) repeat protein